jgi:hypothetical protein
MPPRDTQTTLAETPQWYNVLSVEERSDANPDSNFSIREDILLLAEDERPSLSSPLPS